MAVDKRISVKPNEVGIGSIKRKKVEVIPFKPKPDSPFATPEGIFDLPKPKPEDKPEDKKMPFFSLVGISTKDQWLCARGRGGGLAIWVKS